MRSPHCCDAAPLPGVLTGDIISLLLLSPTPVALSDSSWQRSPRTESLKHNARSHGVPEPGAAPAAALNPPAECCQQRHHSVGLHAQLEAPLCVRACTGVPVFARRRLCLCLCKGSETARPRQFRVFTFNYGRFFFFFSPFSNNY